MFTPTSRAVTWISASLIAAAALLPLSCVFAADNVQEERAVTGSFTAIKVMGSADVQLIQGSPARIVVSAPQDVIRNLTTSISGDSLSIAESSGFHLWPSSHAHVTVTAPDIRALKIVGAGDLSASGLTVANNLELEVAGSGSINIAGLAAREVHTHIFGSGDVVLAGHADSEKVAVNGSGDYKARDLDAPTVAVNSAGSGDITVRATKTLAVQIAGSGDVRYVGKPSVSTAVAGSGHVSAID